MTFKLFKGIEFIYIELNNYVYFCILFLERVTYYEYHLSDSYKFECLLFEMFELLYVRKVLCSKKYIILDKINYEVKINIFVMILYIKLY